MQMRFRTGTNVIGSDRVVDGDIFEIGNRCRPIVLRIADPQVKRIRIEIRFINKKETLVVDIFGESKEKNIEWRYVMQMRFRTGTNVIGSDRVVDGDIFEIGNRCRPIVLRIADPQVKRIRIEIRFINKMLNFLPKFDDGDVTLRFGDQSLQVHGALLGLYSNHMAMKIKDAGESGIIDMEDCDISAFKEVLYQVYPTKRPIWSDFKGITKAAIKFKVDGVLEMIKKYLINYEHVCVFFFSFHYPGLLRLY
uniref:BTB domain-containing protein n=1 Tax=Ascaris lumbricoides TaxID=6252 RepID=A0A0M3IWI9_ASCLU